MKSMQKCALIILLLILGQNLWLPGAFCAGETIPSSEIKIAAPEFFPKYPLARVIDGNSQTFIAGPTPAGITLDLGRSRSIDWIRLQLPQGSNRYYQYSIEASVDGRTWSKLIDRSRNTQPSTGLELHRFEAVETSFIRINCLHNSAANFFYLNEIEIGKGEAPGDAGRQKDTEAKPPAAVSAVVEAAPGKGQQADYLREWLEITRGENVALKKIITASVKPNFKPAPNNRLENLLDGKISGRADGRIYLAPEAFAWTIDGVFRYINTGIALVVDLERVFPIKTIAMRVMGGGATSSNQVPRKITALVSEDGRDFYEVDTFHKIGVAEADAANNRNLFYLEESGELFVFPVSFRDLKIKARYVAFKVSGTSTFFADEIAVIKGDFRPEEVKFSAERRRPFVRQGIGFHPEKNVLAVSHNIITPNFFCVTDMRKAEDMKDKATYFLELPAFLEVLQTKACGKLSVQDLGGGRKKWTFTDPSISNNTSMLGPIYIKVSGEEGKATSEASFYAEAEGYKPERVDVELMLLDIPRTPPLRNFHVSLGWLPDMDRADWPSFLEAYQHLGFNALATFPQNYMDKSPVGKRMSREKVLAELQEARRRGLGILQIEPAFHLIYTAHAGRDEIYSQLADALAPGRTGRQALCPSYRGALYREEIARVGQAVGAVKPDYIFFDIECWNNGIQLAPLCKTCRERRALLGSKAEKDFICSLGKEHIADLQAEVRRYYAPGKSPQCGTYGMKAQKDDDIWKHNPYSWEMLSSQLLDFTQPSLYVGGDAARVHAMLSAEFKAAGKRVCIPWLSTGTGGEYDPRRIEPMIYTAFLDGVAGITYFQFPNFDTPLDFYYHSRAMTTLAPLEELLATGNIALVDCSNPRILLSAWENPIKGSTLVLIYNHISDRKESVQCSLPMKNAAEVAVVRELLSGRRVEPAATISLSLEPGEFKLYLVQTKRP